MNPSDIFDLLVLYIPKFWITLNHFTPNIYPLLEFSLNFALVTPQIANGFCTTSSQSQYTRHWFLSFHLSLMTCVSTWKLFLEVVLLYDCCDKTTHKDFVWGLQFQRVHDYHGGKQAAATFEVGQYSELTSWSKSRRQKELTGNNAHEWHASLHKASPPDPSKQFLQLRIQGFNQMSQ